MREWFTCAANKTSSAVGSPWALLGGIGLVIVWLLLGPVFHYSDRWQLIINSFTGIVTFLVVVLIQHTQNRDARVMQLKLDELIRALASARTELVQMEALTDRELDVLQREFERLKDQASTGLERIESRMKARRHNELTRQKAS